jgi:branched-chain amino acid transport system substrate-binding protein
MLTMVKTFPSQGLNIARVSTFGGGVQTPALLQAGDQAEGVTGFTMWNPDLNRPGVKAFAEKFKQKLGVDPNQNGVKSYAGIWILKEVIERTGSLDKDKLRETLTKIEITSGPAMVLPTSKISFDATGQLRPTHIAIQVQKGAFRTVWPDDVSAAPLDTTKIKQGMVVQ